MKGMRIREGLLGRLAGGSGRLRSGRDGGGVMSVSIMLATDT